MRILQFTLTILLSCFHSLQAQVPTQGLAVVIVDMQPDFWTTIGEEEPKLLSELVAHNVWLLEWAVKEHVPVLIFEFNDKGPADARLMKVLKAHPYKTIIKYTNNGFLHESTHLNSRTILQNWGFNRLLVAGINSPYCIRETVQGALEEGFSVVTSADIVGDFSYPPYIYPDNSWFPDDKNFSALPGLEYIIDMPKTKVILKNQCCAGLLAKLYQL